MRIKHNQNDLISSCTTLEYTFPSSKVFFPIYLLEILQEIPFFIWLVTIKGCCDVSVV